MSQTCVKTDFQKVCDFNQAFDFPQYDDFENKKCLKLRLDLIEEELNELTVAYDTHNIIEEMDACADILYVAYGMAYTYKINSDDFLNYLVEDNTMSLFKNIKKYVCNKKSINDIKSKMDLLDLMCGEFKKLTETCNLDNKDWIDTLHNIIIYVYEFQVMAGYDSDKIFTLVHESNMSKLCKSLEEAQQTVDKYKQEYENKKSPYDTPYFYLLTIGAYAGYYIVKNKSSGKALKSINYTAVKLNLNDYLF